MACIIMATFMIIIALFIDFSHSSPNIRLRIAGKRSDSLNYLLTESVFPEHYDLKLFPRIDDGTFSGYMKILIHIDIPTNNITLHQKNLEIIKEKIFLTTNDDSIINITNAGNSGTEEQEFYTISFLEKLKKDTYYLHIPEFYGTMNNSLKGFYRAEYIDEHGKLRQFGMTKFEPTWARYAFPCFDEPSFRATFKIYMVRPSNYHSVSNTKLIKSIKLNNSLYEDEFEITVKMSTYLVAFIVSEMKLSPEGDQHFFRNLARPEAVEKNYEKHALNLSAKILETLETYFNVNYSLNKMEQAAIPDEHYKSGASENWGLIMYKEKGFLFTPRTTTNMNMYIDTVITHEFIHQWFGNLVSIKWWRYLWLKEGFARFLESKLIDKIKPEWRKMEQFIVNQKHDALERDSSNLTRDMNQDAGTPEEISALYDIIAYTKAACVIQMIETIMTPSIFQRGLTNYLQDRAFQSVVPTDLYRNLQKAIDNSAVKLPKILTIEKIMITWDSQKGYPLVHVERNYNNNEETVKLTQYHYDTPPLANTNSSRLKVTTWYIPINYATKSNPNFNDTQFSNWLLESNEKITIKNLNRSDWLILNKQEAYYYRVNYDIQNWKLIIKALLKNHSDIHILNRAQMIDDSFELAQDPDKLDFSIPLQISAYVYKDDEYIIHYTTLRKMVAIAKILRGSEMEQTFKNSIIRMLQRSYKRLGNNPQNNDTQIDKLHRPLVVRWMCNLDYFMCRNRARSTFNLWRNHNVSLPVDLEEEIMCNAIRLENETVWYSLFNIYNSESNAGFKKNVFRSLACSEDNLTLQRFLDSSLNPSNTYELPEVVKLVSEHGLVGAQLSMNYVALHFNLLQVLLGDVNITEVLTTITSYFTTEEQLDNFTDLLKKNRTVDNAFLLVLQNARLLVSHRQKLANRISEFYQKSGSTGNFRHAFSNIFSIILYSLIITC